MSLNMRGVSGELRKGYQTVARFGAWSMNESGRIEATAIEFNEFRLEQGGPFSVRLQVGQKVWAWREADVLQPAPSLVVKAFGSPEVR